MIENLEEYLLKEIEVQVIEAVQAENRLILSASNILKEQARKEKGVLYIENRYKVGDTIKVSRTISQFHIRMYIVADNEAEMKEKIERLQTSVQAYDINGEPMLITHFDTNKLSFGDNDFSR